MIEILEKKNCCGCAACVQICPESCISFNEDEKGFRYPLVDKDICIDCGLCVKVCPVINQAEEAKPLKVYASKNNNEDIRLKSSSGGMFTLLAEKIINAGGVVFGARFNDVWEVEHDYVETIEDVTFLRGSKYTQSIIGNTYREVEAFLKQGREVLFTGTSCQIAGLKLFLRKEYENLYLVDIVCHGVPSPLVWRRYLNELVAASATKNSVSTAYTSNFSTINSIEFRNKETGWKKFSFRLETSATQGAEKNTVFAFDKHQDNIFMRGFLSDLYLRPSCHFCPSKKLKSGADLTLADYWGIANVLPEFDDDKGVSLVLVNTDKGQGLYSELDQVKIETTYEDALRGNPVIERSVAAHKKRDYFFNRIEKRDIIPTVRLIMKKDKLNKLPKRIIRKGLRILKIK